MNVVLNVGIVKKGKCGGCDNFDLHTSLKKCMTAMAILLKHMLFVWGVGRNGLTT